MSQKVLIVDDDRTMNSLLQILLELDGFSVVLCPRGDEVLSTAAAQKPDVVLMDLHIGEVDGVDLLRQIRQHPELKSLPVIMSSGMDREDECKAAGANAFVLKPYPPAQLSDTLRKVLS